MNPLRILSRRPRAWLGWLPALLLALVTLACGGGSDKASASFGLSVPSVSVEIGQNATTTLSLSRVSGFTSDVTVSVVSSTLPTGVKVNLATSSLSGTASTDEVTLQAGYPDPTDPTDSTYLYPSVGTYSITLQGVSTTETVTSTLKLTVTSASKGFALSWVDSNYYLDNESVISVAKGGSQVRNFAPYSTNSLAPYADGTTATLAVQGLPTGLTVSFGDNPAAVDYVTTVTLAADSNLSNGTYTFYIKGTVGSSTHYLPVQVIVSSSSVWIETPSAVSLGAGNSLTLPISLGRNGTFYQDNGGTNPDYLYTTALSLGTLPAGITSASFDNTMPSGLAQVHLTLSADSAAATGTRTLPLMVTRNGVSATTNLTVNITSAAGTGTYWLQNLEWGQTVLKGGLRLVPGKKALLVAQILGDRAGITAPTFTATLKNSSGSTLETLTLTGPAEIPVSVAEGNLNDAYIATVPATDIESGMTVTLSGGELTTTLTPAVVDKGYQFNLKVVPIIHQGISPVLPDSTDISDKIKAFWPVKSVAITERAAYMTSTVIATPPSTGSSATDYSAYGWVQILDELTALRAVDGSTSQYYGFIDLSLPSSWSGSSIVGLSWLGDGVGMGIDETTGALFGSGEDLLTMAHELGHGLNLKHVSGGGASDCQMNYPYYLSSLAPGGIGTWGYDSASSTLYSPNSYSDIMSYLSNLWVSDWNYSAAQYYLDSVYAQGLSTVVSGSVKTIQGASSGSKLLVSGWIAPDGTTHLSPLERAYGSALAAKTGTHELSVTTASGTTSFQFGATQIQDLPSGFKHFAFTIDGSEAVQSLALSTSGGVQLKRVIKSSLATRQAALAADVASQSFSAKEVGGNLLLTWDSSAHPYVTVVHVGAERTTLGLRLTGGSATVSLKGVSSGGAFQVYCSDGINPIRLDVTR